MIEPMDAVLKKLMEGASDAGSLARSMAKSGIKSVNEVFRGTKIFGALSSSADAEVDHDETHYLLIPLLGDERKYAIYTKRILPPDVGTSNSLPKARIFHVPDPAAKKLLEQELVAEIVKDQDGDAASSSDLADTLEKMADQIDRETNKISGGLFLIGGTVAVMNPLLGVGIAAKGLFPSISAKASKTGAEYVGNKLRDWKKSSVVSKLRKEASKEVQKLKPQIYANPIIRGLEAISTTPETDFDPALDQSTWADQFATARHYAVTLEAVQEIYRDERSQLDLSAYQEVHLRWIEALIGQV